jgi:hypothetical protein
METLIQDVKQALRTLRDSPGFTATALVALVLGIGVNTAIFSVLSAVLFKPLPFSDPDRLVLIMQSFRGAPTQVWSSPAEVAHWQRHSDVLEDVGAWKTVLFDYTAGDAPLSVRAGTVTEGYFRALRTSFIAGRGFAPGEDLPGAAKTVVISHAFRTRRLNGDPGVLGKAIPLNGEPHTVIGITSADFDVLHDGRRGRGISSASTSSRAGSPGSRSHVRPARCATPARKPQARVPLVSRANGFRIHLSLICAVLHTRDRRAG